MAAVSYDDLKSKLLKTLGSNDFLLQQCLEFSFCHIINSRKIEDEIKSLPDLVNILEQRDELSENYITPLKKLAKLANDYELYIIINDYENKIGNKKQSTCECGETKFFKDEEIVPPKPNTNQVVLDIPSAPSHPPSEQENNLSDIFQFLERNLGKHWKILARSLKIAEGEIEGIDRGDKDLKVKICEMLNLWKKERGEEASVSKLCLALGDCKRKDLVDAILRKYPFS